MIYSEQLAEGAAEVIRKGHLSLSDQADRAPSRPAPLRTAGDRRVNTVKSRRTAQVTRQTINTLGEVMAFNSLVLARRKDPLP